jgi:hypothetical protein
MSGWKSRWSWERFVKPDGGPVDRVGAAQLERVGGDLHHAVRVARGEHRAERGLQLERLGRGPDRRGLDAAHDARHRPSRPVGCPAAASRPRSRWAEVVLPFVPVMPTTRRRAVGSPASAAAAGAIARGRRPPRPAARPRPRQDVVDHERRRAARHGRRGEVVAVAGEAGHAEEDGPGLHPAVVERERADRDGRLLGPEQVAQRHRAQGYFGGMRRYGSANWAMSPKAGAATSPP